MFISRMGALEEFFLKLDRPIKSDLFKAFYFKIFAMNLMHIRKLVSFKN